MRRIRRGSCSDLYSLADINHPLKSAWRVDRGGRVGHPPPKRVRWRPHRGASQIMWKFHRAIPINRVLQEWPPPKASDVGQGTPDLQSGYLLNIRSVTGGALERPPHDSSLLRRAMLIAIGQKLKAESDPPTDLTPELRNILRRLEEQKDNEK